jgi:hypothetical protein
VMMIFALILNKIALVSSSFVPLVLLCVNWLA